MAHLRTILIHTGLILAELCAGQYPGLVTLEGRQFMVDGQPFYPMVVNFRMEYVHPANTSGTPDPNNVFYSIDGSAGSIGGMECTDPASCETQLIEALEKVADMGFNAIRIIGPVSPAYTHAPDLGPNERRFMFESADQADNGSRVRQPMSGPDFLDGASIRHFQLLREMLDAANAVGLKVILLVADKSWPNSATGATYMYPTFDVNAVEDYRQYLVRLAAELQGHPALLAYDLWNEPHYFRMQFQQHIGVEGLQYDTWKKREVCEFTTTWYDALKLNDPEHLVTLGGLGVGDLEIWDPATLKIDFYSLHVYPEKDYAGNFDYHTAMNRYKGELYWFGRKCHMPWIIGETGFSANDATGLAWPEVNGTETQQAAFAFESMSYARALGASGYSWWAFQDFRWYTPDPQLPGQALGNYYGLLRSGDTNAPWYEKPAVDVFRNYTPAPVPEQAPSPPPDLYNPAALQTPVWHTGLIEDQFGRPVELGVVKIWTESLHSETPDYVAPKENFFFTYTDPSGSYSLNIEPVSQGFDPPLAMQISSEVYGGSNDPSGIWTGGPPNSFFTTHTTEIHTFILNNSLTNTTITEDYTGSSSINSWYDLSIYACLFTSTAGSPTEPLSIRSRSTISIGNETHMEQGAEIHISAGETWVSCGDASFNLNVLDNRTTRSALTKSDEQVSRIELSFKALSYLHPQVLPNPFDDHLKIVSSEQNISYLRIYDQQGRLVNNTNTIPSSNVVIETKHLAAGSYILKMGNDVRHWNFTLIKTP